MVTHIARGDGGVAPAGSSTRARWLILFLISLMYMVTYMDRANVSVTAPAMQSELGLSKAEMGFVFSAFVWAYALGQVPGGWLGDRFGPRRVLLAIVPFCSLMTAATGWATGALSLFAVRFVFGLGEAGAFPTATRAMQLWFPKSERGLVQGVTHCFSRLAVTITPLLSVVIMSTLGWRWVFYLFALVGILWSAAFFLRYHNRPEEDQAVNEAELAYIRGRCVTTTTSYAAAPEKRPAVPWKSILRSPNMWFIALAYGCFFYGTYFYVTWFPTYLLEYRHLSLQSVGIWAGLPLVAAMIGDIAGGLLTDTLLRKTNKIAFSRRIVAAPAMLASALFLIPAATTGDALMAILCLTASNFFLEMVLGPAWAVPMDVAGQFSGTVTGVMNMTGAIGASISPLVFGMLVVRGSWIAPFFVTAGVLITGALIWAFLIDPEKSVVERPDPARIDTVPV